MQFYKLWGLLWFLFFYFLNLQYLTIISSIYFFNAGNLSIHAQKWYNDCQYRPKTGWIQYNCIWFWVVGSYLQGYTEVYLLWLDDCSFKKKKSSALANYFCFAAFEKLKQLLIHHLNSYSHCDSYFFSN